MQKDEIQPGELGRYAFELKAAVEVICNSPPFRTSKKSSSFFATLFNIRLKAMSMNSRSGSSASCCWAAKPPTILVPTRVCAFVQTMSASGWPPTTQPTPPNHGIYSGTSRRLLCASLLRASRHFSRARARSRNLLLHFGAHRDSAALPQAQELSLPQLASANHRLRFFFASFVFAGSSPVSIPS